MRYNNLIPNNNLLNVNALIKSLNEEAQQSVLKLINDLSNEEEKEQIYYCRRCGRPIKHLESVNQNMGPICYKHYCEEIKKKHKHKNLF